MTPAAHALLEWWDHMAAMFARYGNAEGIESTPEWEEHQRRQKTLVEELRREMASSEELIMETLQASILEMLGTEPTRISCAVAEQIVVDAKRRAAEREARKIASAGMMN
jgi:hypothetical protein